MRIKYCNYLIVMFLLFISDANSIKYKIYKNASLEIIINQIKAYEDYDLNNLNKLGTDYQQVKTRMLNLYTRELDNLMSGYLPTKYCYSDDQNNPTIYQETLEPSKLTTLKDLNVKWERLIQSDFLFVSLIMDMPVIEKSISEINNPLEFRKHNCQSYNEIVKALRCFQTGGKACYENYNLVRKKLKSIELVDTNNTVKSLFSQLKPFIAYIGQDKINGLVNSGISYEDALKELGEVINSSINESVSQYQQYNSAEQIMLLLTENTSWLDSILGLTDLEIKLIDDFTKLREKQEKALLKFMNGNISAAEDELVNSVQIESLSKTYRANYKKYVDFKNRVLTTVEELESKGNLYYEFAEDLIDDPEKAKKKQLEVIKNSGSKIMSSSLKDLFQVHVQLTPNGKTSNDGSPLNTARLHLVSFVKKQIMAIPQCLSGQENCATEPNPFDYCKSSNDQNCSLDNKSGDLIDLGVVVDDVMIESDGSYTVYCPPRGSGGGSCINTKRAVTSDQITKILELIGAPPIVPIVKEANYYISNNLQDLSFDIDFNPFRNIVDAQSIKVQLLQSGKLNKIEDIARDMSIQIKDKVIKPGINKWLLSMPFISESQNRIDNLISIVVDKMNQGNITFVYEEGSVIPKGLNVVVPVRLGSSNNVILNEFGNQSYNLKITINQSGVYINPTDVANEMYSKVQQVASRYINKVIEPLAVDENSKLFRFVVNPVFSGTHNKFEFGLDIIYSIDAAGCVVSSDNKIEIKAPFKNFDKIAKDLFASAKNQIVECVKARVVNEAIATLLNNEITIFGITASISGKPIFNQGLSSANFDIRLKDEQTNQDVVLKNVTATRNDSKFNIDFRSIDWDYKKAGVKVGYIIEARIRKIFLGKNEYFEMSGILLSRDGFSFELLVHDLPYIGSFNVGRIYLNALSDSSLETMIKNELVPRLEDALKNALHDNVDIPDLGPIKNIIPNISIDDSLKISAKAELQLYGGMSAPINIEMFPNQSVKVPEGETIALGFLNELLNSYVPIKIGDTFEFSPPPTQVKYFPNLGAYGVLFGFKINVDIVKIDVDDVVITTKKIILPDAITATINYPIYIPPFIVIANSGFTYYFNTNGFTINGEITIVDESITNIVMIDASIGMESIEDLTFILKGKLIAASSLPLFTANGLISLKDKLIEYDAGTTKVLKPILNAQGEGRLDGEGWNAYNKSSIKIMGIHITDSSFKLIVPENKKLSDGIYKFRGSQKLLIGDVTYIAQSDLKFKNPSATAGARIRLGGWNVMSGSLLIDLYRAKLDFKALGVKIKVIAPSIKSISPRLLLQILADLLKVDLKSLLKMKLDEIVINLMDKNGKSKESPEDEKCEGQNCKSIPPVPVPPKPPNPVCCNPPVPVLKPPCNPATDEKCKNPIVSEEPSTPGYYACYEQLNGRYEFQRVLGVPNLGSRGHKHNGTLQQIEDWHPVTFDTKQYSTLCSGNTIKNQWKPVAARQIIKYNQYEKYDCDNSNKLNIEVIGHETATWNQYGHGYYCGSITADSTAGFKKVVEIKLDDIDYDTWLTLDDSNDEYDANAYNYKLEKAFKDNFDKLSLVGNPQLHNTLTKLEFKFKFCFFKCHRSVVLHVYSQPKNQVHDWKQAFHLFYNNGEFWYLSMCEPKKLLKDQLNIKDPAYIKYCKTTLKQFNTNLSTLGIENKKADFDDGKVWLEPSQYYFLLEKRAVKHFNNEKMDEKLTENFKFIKNKIEYEVHIITTGNSANPPIELFIYTKQLDKPAIALYMTHDNPLYKWMKHPFRNEILKIIIDKKSLTPLVDDIKNDKLILLDESSWTNKNTKHVETLLFSVNDSKTPIIKKLYIEKSNPYSNNNIFGDDLKIIVDKYYAEITQSDWDYLDFGIDHNSKIEIHLFSNQDNLKLYVTPVNKKGNLGSNISVGQSNRIWENNVEKLLPDNCLNENNRIGVVNKLTQPELYYPSIMTEHPFEKLSQPHCL